MVLLAGEFLKEAKPFVEEGVHPQLIIRSFRTAANLVSYTANCPLCDLSRMWVLTLLPISVPAGRSENQAAGNQHRGKEYRREKVVVGKLCSNDFEL